MGQTESKQQDDKKIISIITLSVNGLNMPIKRHSVRLD